MITIDLGPSFFKVHKRRVALATLWMLLAGFTGNALLEQMQKHAMEDRLSFGTKLDTCIRAACLRSPFSWD